MFEKYMICENDFRNVLKDGQVTGFQVNIRFPYYRGIRLSMVENIDLTVDGTKVTKELITFTLGDRCYTLNQMENMLNDRWEFGEEATITVNKPNGLVPGLHQIVLEEQLRLSYSNDILTGKDCKTLMLEG